MNRSNSPKPRSGAGPVATVLSIAAATVFVAVAGGTLLSGSSEPVDRVPEWLRRLVYDRDGGACGHCRRAVPYDAMHVDHRKPRANGGTNDPRNLITSCAPCNLLKGTTDENLFHQLLRLMGRR